jgi:hypothetical protein
MSEVLLRVIAYPFWAIGEGSCRALTWLKHRAGHVGEAKVTWRPEEAS